MSDSTAMLDRVQSDRHAVLLVMNGDKCCIKARGIRIPGSVASE